jgi:hypothetical protein
MIAIEVQTMTASIIDSLKVEVAQRVELLKNHPAMGELLKLHVALNHLEDVEGVPRTSIAQFFGFEGLGQIESTAGSSQVVQPGQYLGWSPLDAAKDFLSRRAKSATLDEIIAGLKTGSCDPGSRDKFGLSLSRSTFNFVKLGDDLYDLLERYPNEKLKRGTGGKRKPVNPARVEEIMSHGPISLANAVAKAEQEENEENQ